MTKIIDAENLKLGRLASYVAKEALRGEEITILNAENAVITGNRKFVFSEKLSDLTSKGTRYHGPFFPKRADRILKRTIRGMLPYKKEGGRKALSRVKVYIGVPSGFEGKKYETLETAKLKPMERRKYLKLGELSKHLGSG